MLRGGCLNEENRVLSGWPRFRRSGHPLRCFRGTACVRPDGTGCLRPDTVENCNNLTGLPGLSGMTGE